MKACRLSCHRYSFATEQRLGTLVNPACLSPRPSLRPHLGVNGSEAQHKGRSVVNYIHRRLASFASATIPPKAVVRRPRWQQTTDISIWLAKLDELLTPIVGGRQACIDQSNASAILGLLTDARRRHDFDLLAEMGRQGRWKACQGAIDHLVRSLWHKHPLDQWNAPASPFKSPGSWDDLLKAPVTLHPDDPVGRSPRPPIDLDQKILDEHPFERVHRKRKQSVTKFTGHQALGEVWQSLGNMIIADAARKTGRIQSEILEILASLHDKDIMPSAVYTFAPDISGYVGSQPPTLHLLSSQIMVNLADAAWRARQAAALEHIRSGPDDDAESRPEVRSSSYRIHIGGIRHEIWLELVLWSCLHGGWVLQGAAVMQRLMKQEHPRWSPLSWRETLSPVIQAGHEAEVDWQEMGRLFTHARKSDSQSTNGKTSFVENTISSELISAYVDAVANQISLGVGQRGLQAGAVAQFFRTCKQFLRLNNFSLESTSWDAMLQRILESAGVDVEKAPGLGDMILGLSSSYGEERIMDNKPTRDEAWRPLSPYMIDGSALTLGVSHRVLLAYITAGDFAGAFNAFRALQTRTDNNKKSALAAFFQKVKAPETAVGPPNIDFIGSHAGVEYPAMHTMLPGSILAPFLDLITAVGSYRFGAWLITSRDVDGPVVNALTLRDPSLIAALIRFSAASKDKSLLAKMLQVVRLDRSNALSSDVLFAIAESQFQLKNPAAAMKTVATILKGGGEATVSRALSEGLLAMLAREVLRSRNPAASTELLAMLEGKYWTVKAVRYNMAVVLMSADRAMKELVVPAMDMPSDVRIYPTTKAFNIVLNGCLEARGSRAGRDLLCRFSKTAVQALQEDIPPRAVSDSGIPMTAGRMRPTQVHRVFGDELDFRIRKGRVVDGNSGGQVHVRGRFTPDVRTIRLILAKRLRELNGQSHEEQDELVTWSRRMLRSLGVSEDNIAREVQGFTLPAE